MSPASDDAASPERRGGAELASEEADAGLFAFRAALSWMVRNQHLAGDLPLRQIAVLATLVGQPGEMTCSALARALGVPRVAITRATASLGERGLIAQRRNPADRRSTLLSVTEGGERLVRRIAAELAEADGVRRRREEPPRTGDGQRR